VSQLQRESSPDASRKVDNLSDPAVLQEKIASNREFLKAHLWGEWKLRDLPTDQRRNLPQPPQQKPYPVDARCFDLMPPGDTGLGKMSVFEAIARRRSRREYSQQPFTLAELSFLLWAMQGVHGFIREGTATSRTVPSGGARHPFEVYLFINRVEGLSPGLYRYLALEHRLLFMYSEPDLPEKVYVACYQEFVKNGALVFVMSAVPYRTEWRYSFLAHKVIAQETGHICQNLYLACESIGAGACALGTYNQVEVDALLGLDGEEEFAVYVAVAGKLP
jgi:SagB-type dehydrogenase family enzyme